MAPYPVVEPEVACQTLACVPHALVVSPVDLLILDTPPQALHKHVVQGPPTALHAETNAAVLEPLSQGQTRELYPRIGSNNLWLAVPNRLLQGLHTPRDSHGDRHRPRQHIP